MRRFQQKGPGPSRHFLRALAILSAGSIGLAAPARAEAPLDGVDFQLQAAPTSGEADTDTSPADWSLLTHAAVIEELQSFDGGSSQAETRSDQIELSFGDHVRSIKTELAIAFGYMTAVNLAKIAARGNLSGFSFHDEGLFEKDTRELGMDKLVHAHNTYVMSELIGARIRRNTGTSRGTALSGALLGTGLNLYSEFYDGFKKGFGFYDLAFNSMGAAFSVIRHTTPGLEEKLDFRVLIMPNRNVYSPTGKEHYRQLRYLFALELGGFDGLRTSPLRFVELHAGYYGSGFTNRERDRGEPLERRLFAGIGINLNELFFNRSPRSRAARAASQALDYWQPPYTYLHFH